MQTSSPRDPWSNLQEYTSARIALGRAGASLPTRAVIDFAIAHAAARDAVHEALDAEALRDALMPLGHPVALLSTLAHDRETYLRRPDLGRRLNPQSLTELGKLEADWDVVFIVADGLSASAPRLQASALLGELIPLLEADHLRIGPICIVRQGRVAVQDEIGLALRGKISVILIGERPGLGTSDSLGAYLVFDPKPGRSDAERNCGSNIRAGGLSDRVAARTLHYLITESLRRRLSGVGLKDERTRFLSGDESNAAQAAPPPALL